MILKKIITGMRLAKAGFEFHPYKNCEEAYTMEKLFSGISLSMAMPFMDEESIRRYAWLHPKGRRIYRRAG